MTDRSTRRRAGAGATAALLVLGAVLSAQPAAAAPATRTVSTTAQLTDELASPAAAAETIVLGADLGDSPSAAGVSQDASALTVDLAGHALALGSLVVGRGASLRITDSTASGGTLTVNGTAAGGTLVDTPVWVRSGTVLVVDGTARISASGGRSSAVIGGRASPDGSGAGEIDVLGHAVVDARGSSSGGRTSSGIGGPLTSIHIGEQAVVTVVATSSGAALGGGSGGTGGDSTVLIDGDAVVSARSAGSGGAAIGSSSGIASNRLTAVTIGDRARVTAVGGPYGPGIGNGAQSGTRTTLTVEGTAVVDARGGVSAAGIGGGATASTATSGGDGAAVTIRAGATVTAAGGSGSDDAVGSGTGRAGASFGSLANAGRLVIPAGSRMTIPASGSVTNSGVVLTSSPIGGPGVIANSGTIATLGSGGALSPATPITGDRWSVGFDPGAAAPAGPTGLRLTADTIGAGGVPAPLPTPPAGQVVLGWNTAADGSGRYVDDTTDLRTVATASSSAAVPLALHAVLAATADAVPRLPVDDPAAQIAGTASTTPFGVVSGARPVTYRVSTGSLPDGLALDPATGDAAGTPSAAGSARFTVEATNRFGSDSHEYLMTVSAPPSPAPTASPSAAPIASPAPTAAPDPAPAAAPSATAAPAPTAAPDPAAAPLPTSAPVPTTAPVPAAGAPGAAAPAESAAPTESAAAASEASARTAPVSDSPVPTSTPLPTLPHLPASLPRTRLPVGDAVQQTVGAPGVAVVLTAGALPAGLRIDRPSGAVRGTPTRPGRYRFTLTAMTAAGSTVRSYSLVVVAPLAVAVLRPESLRRLPLVAGSQATVRVSGLLRGERFAVRWAGRTVARGTAAGSSALLRLRVPARAGLRALGVRAADHADAPAMRTRALPAGAVLRVTAPAGVQANRMLEVRVQGLAPGEPVRVSYEGRRVSPEGAHADRHGAYRLDASAGWSWGWKAVEVHGFPGRTGTARVAVLPRRD